MPSIKWEYSLAIVFGVCSLLLIFLMVAQLHYANNYKQQILREIENVESAGFTLQSIPESPLTDITLDEYGEMVERPLFFEGRRPIIPSNDDTAEALGEEQTVAEEITFSLIGIINTPESTYALFHDPKAKPDETKFKRFKQGDEISGWTLTQIKPDRVSVTAGTESKEIMLAKPRVHTAVPTSRARRRAAPKKTNPFQRKTNK